jgi:hypothetical protein
VKYSLNTVLPAGPKKVATELCPDVGVTGVLKKKKIAIKLSAA